MTDKEFKQLSRAQLIDIIYQLQLQVEELSEQNQNLKKALEDKRLRIRNAGSIAEAALELNDCFRSAQNAAEHYLQEIKTMRDETQAECMQILTATRAEAERIIATAQRKKGDYDCAVEAILNEYKKNHWDNG